MDGKDLVNQRSTTVESENSSTRMTTATTKKPPRYQTQTSLIISCNSASVGFWPKERITVPSSFVVMVPSPSLSKREKASLNSAICSSAATQHKNVWNQYQPEKGMKKTPAGMGCNHQLREATNGFEDLAGQLVAAKVQNFQSFAKARNLHRKFAVELIAIQLQRHQPSHQSAGGFAPSPFRLICHT